MSTIYADTDDLYVQKTDSSSWANARGDVSSSGSVYSRTSPSNDFAVYNLYSGGRGGNTFYCRRSYFPFDLSGESGTLESATIQLYLDNLGSTGNSARVTLVQATALAGGLADHGNCYVGIGTSTTLGTEITSYVEVSTTAGYHTFTINADGLTAIQDEIGSGTFTVCLMGDYYDHSNSAPSLGGNYTKIKCYYADYTGTSRDPKLTLTYETVTDNAVFFGTNF